MPDHSRVQTGFTLIETIAAIVLLAALVPGVLWAIQEAHLARANPTMASKARWLAVEKLEDVIADRHSSTRGYSYLVKGNYPAEPSVTGLTAYSRTVSFSETAADLSSAGTGYMTVTVTVGWTDAEGTARSLAIATVLTDYTP